MMAGRLQRLLGDGLHIMPGVHNALSAVLAEMAGFGAIFVSGAGVSNNYLGEPDLGLLTFDQLRAHVEQIVLKVRIPVFVDFDAGYGDAKLIHRQGRQLRDLGVAGVFLEDQLQPKRCGHFEGKQVVTTAEMVDKIHVLRDLSDDWVVVGRTDGLAVEGEEAAHKRVSAYRNAGADATFIEAPTTRQQVERIAALPWPQVINMVEGGKTPLFSGTELKRMGFCIALYANFASRMAMRAMKIAYKSLRMQGDTSVLVDDMISFEERQTIVGLQMWERFEEELEGRRVAVD